MRGVKQTEELILRRYFRGAFITGLIFMILGLALLTADIVVRQQLGSSSPALGQIWYVLDVDSLGLSQAIIQRYIFPPLWDPVISTMLLWPGWAYWSVLLALGVGLLTLDIRRHNRL